MKRDHSAAANRMYAANAIALCLQSSSLVRSLGRWITIKTFNTFLCLGLFAACSTISEDRWKTVDEGFRMTMPSGWRRQKAQPIDSNCGIYRAERVDLEFDEVFGLGYTAEKARAAIEDLKKKETNPQLLKPGEEIWYVDGRIARFWIGKADKKEYGERRFSNVAQLHV